MKTKFFAVALILISVSVFAQTPSRPTNPSASREVVKSVRLVDGTNTIDFGRGNTMIITRRGGKTIMIRTRNASGQMKNIVLGNPTGGTNGGLDCECGLKVITEGWAECIPCDLPDLPFIPSGDLTRIVWQLPGNLPQDL